MSKSIDPMDFGLSAEVGNDGKLHITIERSVVLHIKGDEERLIDGVSFQYSQDDTIVLTGGVHHTNPINSVEVADKVGGLAREHRALMDHRALTYSAQAAASNRRAFYIEAALDNMLPPRLRKRNGCDCK